MGIGMPRLGPYNPEAEPRKLSRRRRLGWGNGSFSIANTLQTSGRIIFGGMFEGACGGLLGKIEKKKKKKEKQKKEKKKKKAALEAAGCCGQALRGLRVAASLSSTKSASSPRCTGGAGRGGQDLKNKTKGSGGRGQEPSGGCRAQGSAGRWGSGQKDSTGLRTVLPGGWHAATGRGRGCSGASGLHFELVPVLSIILCPQV